MLHYQRRNDGTIAVTIDSNVWNLFHDLGLRLVLALPPERFRLFVPREIEIEIAVIPDRPNKADLKEYIRTQVVESNVRTTAVFGFAHQGDGPQRRGGFGFGTFQSEQERQFYGAIREQYLLHKPLTRSQLSRNEADAALGALNRSDARPQTRSAEICLGEWRQGPRHEALCFI
jgi:hypothetical protein